MENIRKPQILIQTDGITNTKIFIDGKELPGVAGVRFSQSYKGTNGKWYCIREYYYSGRDKGKQKTDSEYADDLKEWLDGTKIKAIIVDPSAASFIAELRKRGYKVLKANNDVLDGIRLVGMLLNLQKIVFASSCKETIKEFASYIWDEKALERGEDKPVKQFDHCCDAVRYLCSTIIGRKAARFREIRR